VDAVSVVIIAKNEALHIAACVESARLLSNDVIVVDTGSTDSTVPLAAAAGAKVIHVEWKGYGNARNTGATHAFHDWIFSLDADERITPGLAQSISRIEKAVPETVFGFKRQNFFLGGKIRFGEWGQDKVYRLYHRGRNKWNDARIHESITGTHRQLLTGAIDHYPVVDKEQNRRKTQQYAALNAQKLLEQGKKATFEKRFLSPAFNFVKSYFLLLGFLDGKRGLTIALSTSRYSWLKYDLLRKMTIARKKT
jgi:glycosyltransferase involved in cell wall biosynthesis